MKNPTVKIVNAITTEELEREMNAKEFAQHEKDLLDKKTYELVESQKQALRDSANSKLAALGLSPEEIAAITGA